MGAKKPDKTEADRFVLVDTETFGLDPKTDPILEVGFKIVDTNFDLIDDFHVLVWDSPSYDGRYTKVCAAANDGRQSDAWVLKTHEQSGLFGDAETYGENLENASEYACDFLSGHGIDGGDPMCGSSVQFDRLMLDAWMPSVSQRFHYRNIDISTVKELCRRLNPRVYEMLDQTAPKQELHRVLPDLDDTLNEFRYYRDNFLWEA